MAFTAAREAERTRRAYERSQLLGEIERQRLYLAARQAEAAAANEALNETNQRLESLLRATLDVDDFLDFERLKERPELPPFQPGALATAEVGPHVEAFMPPPLSGIAKMVPGAHGKWERAVAEARE